MEKCVLCVAESCQSWVIPTPSWHCPSCGSLVAYASWLAECSDCGHPYALWTRDRWDVRCLCRCRLQPEAVQRHQLHVELRVLREQQEAERLERAEAARAVARVLQDQSLQVHQARECLESKGGVCYVLRSKPVRPYCPACPKWAADKPYSPRRKRGGVNADCG